jgi:1-acyl-sn-glycerol-3-phosphate acyltransferase
MKILRAIHTVYGFSVFIILFLLLLPFLIIPILFPSQFKLIGIINRMWARLMFLFVFLPTEVEIRGTLDPKKQYIFSPNHFSYLDIPSMGLNPVNTIFVGKSDISKVPLFGWMYSRLHITVNRASLKSKINSLKQCMAAVDQGKSLVIFAEGGMIAKRPPQMSLFKDGAFRVAIEKQIPIVPVTIPFNWIILPDPENQLHAGRVKVIFHEPLETKGMTLADTDTLKEKVFTIIDSELKNENR